MSAKQFKHTTISQRSESCIQDDLKITFDTCIFQQGSINFSDLGLKINNLLKIVLSMSQQYYDSEYEIKTSAMRN